jgi:hypothetical protein
MRSTVHETSFFFRNNETTATLESCGLCRSMPIPWYTSYQLGMRTSSTLLSFKVTILTLLIWEFMISKLNDGVAVQPAVD